jgi:YD repeat-containing protein
MTLTIGSVAFDHATYDAESDVLYLRRGPSRPAAATDASREGHAIRYDEDGRIIGLTIVNAKWLLERDGEITITQRMTASMLEPVLT